MNACRLPILHLHRKFRLRPVTRTVTHPQEETPEVAEGLEEHKPVEDREERVVIDG